MIRNPFHWAVYLAFAVCAVYAAASHGGIGCGVMAVCAGLHGVMIGWTLAKRREREKAKPAQPIQPIDASRITAGTLSIAAINPSLHIGCGSVGQQVDAALEPERVKFRQAIEAAMRAASPAARPVGKPTPR